MNLNLFVVKDADIKQVKEFLSLAGSSLTSFRYFEKRPLSIINNHLVTVILTQNDQPVGYGHLDIEGEKTWLGIAVAQSYKGRGIGNHIMEYLVSIAQNSAVKILSLSVDKDNIHAISLYEKFGFIYVKDINEQSILMERKL